MIVCRLRVTEKELAVSDKKLMSAESQVNELQARLADAVNERRHWEEEYNVSFESLDLYDFLFTVNS